MRRKRSRQWLALAGVIGARMLAPAIASAQSNSSTVALPPPVEPGFAHCTGGMQAKLVGNGVVTCVPAPLPTDVPPVVISWNPSRQPRWAAEFALTGTVGGLRDRTLAGGGLGGGPRYISHYDSRPLADLDEIPDLFIAILTLCAVCVPRGAWAGNEKGFDLRVRLFTTNEPGVGWSHRFTVGIGPALYITRDDSRFRFPSVLQVLSPEVGVSLPEARPPEPYLAWHPFPIGFLVAPHLAVEIDPALLLTFPSGEPSPQEWLTVSLSFVAR